MSVATAPSKGQRPLSTRTADFLRSRKRNLIDGKWIEAASGGTFAVYDPATGQIIDRVPDSGTEDRFFITFSEQLGTSINEVITHQQK